MNLTPNQHGLGAAAAYVGLLAAGMAVIHAVIVTGKESRELAVQCEQMGNSRSFCELQYFGR